MQTIADASSGIGKVPIHVTGQGGFQDHATHGIPIFHFRTWGGPDDVGAHMCADVLMDISSARTVCAGGYREGTEGKGCGTTYGNFWDVRKGRAERNR